MKVLHTFALSLLVLLSFITQINLTQASPDTKPYTITVKKKAGAPKSNKAFTAVVDEDTTSITVTALAGRVKVYSMQWYRGGTFDPDWVAYSNGKQDLNPGPSYASTMKFGYTPYCWIVVEYTNPKTGEREQIDICKPPTPDSDN